MRSHSDGQGPSLGNRRKHRGHEADGTTPGNTLRLFIRMLVNAVSVFVVPPQFLVIVIPLLWSVAVKRRSRSERAAACWYYRSCQGCSGRVGRGPKRVQCTVVWSAVDKTWSRSGPKQELSVRSPTSVRRVYVVVCEPSQVQGCSPNSAKFCT